MKRLLIKCSLVYFPAHFRHHSHPPLTTTINNRSRLENDSVLRRHQLVVCASPRNVYHTTFPPLPTPIAP